MPRYRIRVELEVEAKDREEAVAEAELFLSCGSGNLCESGVKHDEIRNVEKIR